MADELGRVTPVRAVAGTVATIDRKESPPLPTNALSVVAAGVSPARWLCASTILPPGKTGGRKIKFPSHEF
jgi:hypothetical protein